MRKLKLYQIEVSGRDPTCIAATTSDHAAAIYVTFEVAAGRETPSFSVERVDSLLAPEQRLGLDDMLTHRVSGIAGLDPLFGWVVSDPV